MLSTPFLFLKMLFNSNRDTATIKYSSTFHPLQIVLEQSLHFLWLSIFKRHIQSLGLYHVVAKQKIAVLGPPSALPGIRHLRGRSQSNTGFKSPFKIQTAAPALKPPSALSKIRPS